MNTELMKKNARTAFKLWLGCTYWFTAALFILFGLIMEGKSLALVMGFIWFIGWITIVKMVKWALKKYQYTGANKNEKSSGKRIYSK